MRLEIKTTKEIINEPKTFKEWRKKKWVSVESLVLWIEHNKLVYGRLGLGIDKLKKELEENQ